MPDCDGDMVMFVAADNTEVSFDDIRISVNDVSRTATNSTTTGGAEVTNYAFDDWGRMDTETRNSVTTMYKWTSANLLRAVDVGNDGSDEVAYTYTGDLKRVWRHESGELKNTYKWDAGFNVVQETYWSGGSATMTKAYAGGLAEVDVTSTPSYGYRTSDHLGSTRGMWDGNKNQLGSWEYTPYESPYLFAGPSDVTRLFTRHDLDPVTGKYYAPFRYLDPAAGRWLSSDPLGFVDGPNMFSYALGDPIRNSDPYGLECGPADDPIMDFIIPDNPLGCPFGDACEAHDKCYGGVAMGPNQTKEECDKQFLADALKACEHAAPEYLIPTGPFSAAKLEGKKVCERLANVYYKAFNSKRAQRQFDKGRGKDPGGFEFNLTNMLSDFLDILSRITVVPQ